MAQYTPTKSGKLSKELNKDYTIAFTFDTSKQNTLVLTNLKGVPIKALVTEKDQIPISMLEVYHVAFHRQYTSSDQHL